MIEYIIQNLWQLWAVIAVLCLILELSSGDFFIICFSIGAVAAVIAAVMGLNIIWQIVIFALFTMLSIFTVRPMALRWLHKNDPNRLTNADALLGRTGRVVEAIAPGRKGYVQIDGDLWKAVTADATDNVPAENCRHMEIPVGTTVRVIGRESTIITVEPL